MKNQCGEIQKAEQCGTCVYWLDTQGCCHSIQQEWLETSGVGPCEGYRALKTHKPGGGVLNALVFVKESAGVL